MFLKFVMQTLFQLFKAGKPMAYKEIVKKYDLKIGRDDRDVWHINGARIIT